MYPKEYKNLTKWRKQSQNMQKLFKTVPSNFREDQGIYRENPNRS